MSKMAERYRMKRRRRTNRDARVQDPEFQVSQKSIIFKIIFLVFEKTPCGGLRGKRV